MLRQFAVLCAMVTMGIAPIKVLHNNNNLPYTHEGGEGGVLSPTGMEVGGIMEGGQGHPRDSKLSIG